MPKKKFDSSNAVEGKLQTDCIVFRPKLSAPSQNVCSTLKNGPFERGLCEGMGIVQSITLHKMDNMA